MDSGRRVQIPTIGDELTLAQPWTFHVVDEYRNDGLFEHMGLKRSTRRWGESETPSNISATLPAGTKLTVSRIYLRNGAPEYDSLTFRARLGPKVKGKQKSVRFFAKLYDVNKMIVRSEAWTERDEAEAKAAAGRDRLIELDD